MDKYEYKLKTKQMLELMEEGAYNRAAELADGIDWKRVRNATMLMNVSDIYEKSREYQKSFEVLKIAYNRSEGSRKIIYKLCALALRTRNVDEAIDYYDEFLGVAPKDPNQYLLRYQILRAQRAPIHQQIEALESFKKAEYIEEWAFELAKLYHEAGKITECIEECDDLILWFSEGKYVYRAMELKMRYKPLTKSQQDKYDRRYEKRQSTTDSIPKLSAYNQEIRGAQKEIIPEVAEAIDETVEEKTQEAVLVEEETLDNKVVDEEVIKAEVEAQKKAESPKEFQVEDQRAYEDTEAEQETEEAEEFVEEKPKKKIGNTMPLDEALKVLLHLEDEDSGKEADEADFADGWDEVGQEMAEEDLSDLDKAIEDIEAVADLNLAQELEKDRLQKKEEMVSYSYEDAVTMPIDIEEVLELAEAEEIEEVVTEPIDTEEILELAEAEEAEEVVTEPIDTEETLELAEAEEAEEVVTEPIDTEEVLDAEEAEEIESEENDGATKVIDTKEVAAAIENDSATKIIDTEEVVKFTDIEMPLEEEILEEICIDEDTENGPTYQVDGRTNPMNLEDLFASWEENAKEDESGDISEEDILSLDAAEELFVDENENSSETDANTFNKLEDLIDEAEGFEVAQAEPGKEGAMSEKRKTGEPILPPDIQRLIDEIEGIVPREDEEPVLQSSTASVGMKERALEDNMEEQTGMLRMSEALEDEFEEDLEDDFGFDMDEEDELDFESDDEYYIDDMMDDMESPEDEYEEDYSDEEFGEDECEEDYPDEEYEEDEYEEDYPDEEYEEDEYEEDYPDEEYEEDEYTEDDSDEDGYDYENDEYDAEDIAAEIENEFRPRSSYDEYDDRELFEEEEEEKPVNLLSETTPLSRKETAKLIATGKTAPLPVDEISGALSISDTGFLVHNRHELLSEDGKRRMELTDDQKQLFSYFVPVRGMSEQLVDVLEQDKNCTNRQGTSRTGNLLIIGNKGNGKTVLAVDVVKAIQRQRDIHQGKVAIVTGESLNKKRIGDIFRKLYGGALIIEKAGSLNERTVAKLNKAMEQDSGEMLLVLEDQRKPLDRLLSSNQEFRRKFTSRLEVPVFINDELVTFGQTYAQENGYRIDEMGLLALYSRIDTLQREDHSVSVAEVKEVMDEAMEHSKKASARKLVKRVFGRGTDDADRILLTEKDFNV